MFFLYCVDVIFFGVESALEFLFLFAEGFDSLSEILLFRLKFFVSEFVIFAELIFSLDVMFVFFEEIVFIADFLDFVFVELDFVLNLGFVGFEFIDDVLFSLNVLKKFLDFFVIKRNFEIDGLFVLFAVSHQLKCFGLFGFEVRDLFAHLENL